MTTFYMMVGLPASGKSTYAKLLAEEVDGVVVSSDAIRKEWYGDENIQGDPGKIFREVDHRCYNALGAGRSVIMDATNMNAKKRKSFLRQMPECKKVCIVMAVPFDECLARDEVRSRHVGPAVMEKMRRNFQMPYYNEGWDHIEIYYPKDCEMVSSEYHYEMEIAFDQKNSHHSLTVGDHEEKARVIALDKNFDSVVEHAAVYHDCGKIWCQCFKEGDSEAHYYGHECVSAYQFLTMDATQLLYGLYSPQVIEAAALITWHMVCYQFKNEPNPHRVFTDWAINHKFDRDFIDHLWQLHECDVAAH